MRPLGTYVLIHELSDKDTTEGGVILPGAAMQLDYCMGVVAAIHEPVILPDGSERACRLVVGNLVAFVPNSGHAIRYASEPCRLMLEGNVLAVLQDDIMEHVDPALGESIVEGLE